MVPTSVEETAVAPTHRTHIPTVEHPCPIHAVVDIRRKLIDLAVLVEILPRDQHAAEQQGCVDRRDLPPAEGNAALHIVEVGEETVVSLQLVAMESQRVPHARQDSVMWNVAA